VAAFTYPAIECYFINSGLGRYRCLP